MTKSAFVSFRPNDSSDKYLIKAVRLLLFLIKFLIAFHTYSKFKPFGSDS